MILVIYILSRNIKFLVTARVYETDSQYIGFVEQFRNDIFLNISALIPGGIYLRAKETPRGKYPDIDYFDIYSTSNGELLSVHSAHYSDVKKWKPHISIFNLYELEQINPKLLEILEKLPTNDDRTKLIKSINKIKIRPISNISFGGLHINIDQLWVSMRHNNLDPTKIGRVLPSKPIDVHIKIY